MLIQRPPNVSQFPAARKDYPRFLWSLIEASSFQSVRVFESGAWFAPSHDRFRPRSTHRGAKMRRDYVGLASIFLRLAMAPDAMIGSSEIGCQDQGGNAIKTITGRIVRSDNLLFLAEEGSIRSYMLADATHLRVYGGKKVRISGALESPNVIVVRTSMRLIRRQIPLLIRRYSLKAGLQMTTVDGPRREPIRAMSEMRTRQMTSLTARIVGGRLRFPEASRGSMNL